MLHFWAERRAKTDKKAKEELEMDKVGSQGMGQPKIDNQLSLTFQERVG